ncbi:hypothetical protein GOP47_0007577 [Adiantum capillus-veneris]|uniref:Uncharacterized protein n=1 Tax=Adiantum capillus-veneris TaxID=13818 RepID=A0A9D4ZJC8_ADICA|nr:hypothetical protein GOP47_0007577 [Adiantum capillus-veneris]
MAVPEGSTGLIRIAKASCSTLAPNQVHLLPCSISFSGPAPVSDYFRPRITDSNMEGVELKEAAFRGRKLLGRTTELPPGYCGLFLEKEVTSEGGTRAKKKSTSVAAVDIWNAKATFKDVTYWRHDDNPHSVDSGHKFLDWLRLAAMMHKPVSAEEVLMEETKSRKNGQKRKSEET